MKGKKKEDFDYQHFEQQALKAMYEGKSLEQALGPLLKRLVEAGLQGEMPFYDAILSRFTRLDKLDFNVSLRQTPSCLHA